MARFLIIFKQKFEDKKYSTFIDYSHSERTYIIHKNIQALHEWIQRGKSQGLDPPPMENHKCNLPPTPIILHASTGKSLPVRIHVHCISIENTTSDIYFKTQAVGLNFID